MSKEKKKQLWKYATLNGLFFFFSLSGVCSKMAAQQEFLSTGFILFYGGVLLITGIYAIAWQQMLKGMDLTIAFCNKAVTIIWGMIWGMIFFQEKITWKMILGAAIVITGVILVVKSDE